jgi:hypothetical protein
MTDGYVNNFTMSTLVCHQPDVLDLNTAMIHPSSQRVGKALIPLFGGSKLSCNNEILIPAPMYWKDSSDSRYTASDGNAKWHAKQDRVSWRGVASGGIYGKDTWTNQHRMRFISYTNSSQIELVEKDTMKFPNWVYPDPVYNLSSAKAKDLGRWTSTWSDTAFTGLSCERWENGCPYLQPYFNEVEPIPFNTVLNSKYLPDIDGQSYSARFRSYVQSHSVAFKSTLYKEWHDARLVPWKHFVPFDNRYMEFPGIMEYFVGYKDAQGKEVVADHDAVAEAIAQAGFEWGNKVMRKEDMLVYLMRVLLEYARLQDDQRDELGYVADLLVV